MATATSSSSPRERSSASAARSPCGSATPSSPTDNLAPDFPGSYGLWLRASGPGWTLVFNNEPDSWGTQHDPAFDAAEVDIDHTHGGPYEERPLGVSLLPVGDDEGRLVIVWGQHVWAADFTIEP